ncbi:MAG: hypothetical protein ACTSUO_00965 [Candidatus Thorarchaeota archaeon]
MPPNYCPLTRGICRGTKMCDFWARVKLEKKSVDEIVEDLREGVKKHGGNNGRTIREAIDRHWLLFGIKSMESISKEKPALFAKIQQAEAQVLA